MITLQACTQCGLVFADRAIWRNPYQSKDYYEAPGADVLKAKPNRTHYDRISFVRRWIRSGRALDFGGGLGEMAQAAYELGFAVTVIEDSAAAVASGRDRFPGLDWLHAREVPPEVGDGTLDLVMAFHVLEHLVEPRAVLRQFHRALKPGGFFCAEVPNWGSWMRALRGMKWTYVVDHHVNQFCLGTLRSTVEPLGFQYCGREYRRTFAVNEEQPWKEPLKKGLCWFGFGDVVRGMWQKATT